MARDFTYANGPSSHKLRRRAILAAHPEIKTLMGTNPGSTFWILGIVGIQLTTAYSIVAFEVHWLWILPLAYLFGAFLNHALYVQIHECTHNLVFRKPFFNKLLGIVCDLPMVMPSALAFRKYHLLHHKHLGRYDLDPDVVSHREAKLVGSSALRKILWVFFFSLSQGLRPFRIKTVSFWDPWIAANMIACFSLDLIILFTVGPKALAYLALSTLFALGLHPLGGRWIQEHYVTTEDQETYSYYGPLNKACFNMGYHNEHHDFANIPWNNLPKLRTLASDHYEGLKAYRSWTAVLVHFIARPEMSTYNRILYKPDGPGSD